MYIIQEQGKIILADEDLQRLEDTLKFMPQYDKRNIEEVLEASIVKAYDGNLYLSGYEPQEPEEEMAERKRADRDRLLNDSDKRMLPDFPISAEEKELWLLYRQYLRDITKDPAFPNVDVLNFANWLGQIHSKEPVLGVK
nr:MAG TPA: tail assembly chaperone protein [Caudoviricetes sp.]